MNSHSGKILFVPAVLVVLGTVMHSMAIPSEIVVFDQISEVRAVSADGSVIAGRLGLSDGPDAFRDSSAFRWSRHGGLVELQPLNDSDRRVSADTLSADGTVAAGVSWDPTAARAVRWVDAGPPVDLGALPDNLGSVTEGISGDGSVIVGRNYTIGPTINTAFRWTEEGGMESLGSLGPAESTWALGVSPDGSTVVGTAAIVDPVSGFNTDHEAFIWNEENGMVSLGMLPGETTSYARDASYDGSVVVGGTLAGIVDVRPWRFNDRAWRWTEETGMVDLGLLPNSSNSLPVAMTPDGSVIIGNSDDVPFVWDSTRGTRNLLETIRDEHGMDITQHGLDESLKFVQVQNISANKQTVVGSYCCGANAEPYGFAVFLDRPIDVSLRAGDADQDLDFDQLDLVRVQIAGKYLTGEPATWGEGDWNYIPSLQGDGVFNQLDIVVAQLDGAYLAGPYAALKQARPTYAGQTSMGLTRIASSLDLIGPSTRVSDFGRDGLVRVPEPTSLTLGLCAVLGSLVPGVWVRHNVCRQSRERAVTIRSRRPPRMSHMRMTRLNILAKWT